MNIEMQSTLRKLRREKNVTQEQLAAHLSISAQAVGKWERGEGFPDITLLPAIALYFGVSVDELLGVGQIRVQARLEEWCRQSREYTNRGECEKDLALWEEAAREMPHNPTVKRCLMHALYMLYTTRHDRYASLLPRVVEIGEQLLENCTDSGIRENAVQTLCFAYSDMGNKEAAGRYALMAGSYWTASGELLTTVLEGDEAVQQCQSNLMTLTDLLAQNALVMSWKGKYSPEEKIRIILFCIDSYKRLYEDGDYGFYADRLSDRYSELAFQYAQLERREQCLTALCDAADMAVRFDTRGVTRHTSLLVDRCTDDPGELSKNYTHNTSHARLVDMRDSVYDFIRGDAEFAAIEKKLARTASAGDVISDR
ncbi:MAG: helix-turn-helix transcriptional regulator [Eubacteriales bacterium]